MNINVRRIGTLLVVLSLTSLGACQTTNGQNSGINKATIGTLLGAGVGGYAGSKFGKGKGQLAMVALGVLAGGYVGNNIGASLDKADQAAMNQNTYSTLEYKATNQTSRWGNPNRGVYGTMTPTRTYKSNGQDCREYTQTVTISGQLEQATGIACRDAYGQWSLR